MQIAYELLSTGIPKVVIVEDGKIGSGETGRTSGHLSADNEYNEFLSMHGLANTAIVAESQQAAINRIGEIVQKHSINCGYEKVPGFMFPGPPPGAKGYDIQLLQEVWQAASETKKLDIEMVDDGEIPGFQTGRTIRYNNQAVFHPTKYLKGLSSVITNQLRGTIYEDTHMNSYEELPGSTGRVKAVMSNGATVTASQLVMATNVPLQKLEIIDRLEPFRTYCIALKIANDKLSTSGKPALWWDLADPYHYVRSTEHHEPGYSLLIVGGEDAKVGQHNDMDQRYERLEKWTRERWVGAGPVEYKWSGQVWDTLDGLGITGKNPGTKNVYIHTGDNGDGLTYAAIGGIVITDLILGRHNPWASTYDPGRQFSMTHLKRALKSLPSYITENLHDQMYYAKWVTRCRKTMSDIEDLVPGEGDVVRDGVHPTAVYKDPQGKIHKMTAVCPHMKGIVAWNSDEKTFDCPIHGSRFTCKGDVINGPAKGNLSNHLDIVTEA